MWAHVWGRMYPCGHMWGEACIHVGTCVGAHASMWAHVWGGMHPCGHMCGGDMHPCGHMCGEACIHAGTCGGRHASMWAHVWGGMHACGHVCGEACMHVDRWAKALAFMCFRGFGLHVSEGSAFMFFRGFGAGVLLNPSCPPHPTPTIGRMRMRPSTCSWLAVPLPLPSGSPTWHGTCFLSRWWQPPSRLLSWHMTCHR